MKKLIKPAALLIAAIFALSALACAGGGDKPVTTNPPNTPYREAWMPPIKWQSLGDTEVLKISAMGSEKTYTGAELWALDRGQIVGWDDADETARGGKPMYFIGVYMKGFIYAASGTIEYENFKTFKLIGVDGKETDLLKELDGVNLLESVLALQRGGIDPDAEAGCMLVLKSADGDDQHNKIFKGIKQIVIE